MDEAVTFIKKNIQSKTGWAEPEVSILSPSTPVPLTPKSMTGDFELFTELVKYVVRNYKSEETRIPTIKGLREFYLSKTSVTCGLAEAKYFVESFKPNF